MTLEEHVLRAWVRRVATGSHGLYENIRRIEKFDDHTIKAVFTGPTPRWYIAGGQILPKHLFVQYTGAESAQCPV
jgi:peptide/nickel transport system substrate-binding protein